MESGLHNIIFNSFLLALVLWRLLKQSFLFLSYVIVVQKSSCVDWKFTLCGWGFNFLHYYCNHSQNLRRREEKESPWFNRLHNTRMSWKELNIILWRLLGALKTHTRLASLKSEFFKLLPKRYFLFRRYFLFFLQCKRAQKRLGVMRFSLVGPTKLWGL